MDTASIALLAQNDFAQEGGGAAAGAVMLVQLAVIILIFAALWKIFAKAGKPGWAALIPIYNIVVMLEIVGKPIWWVVLFLIPCV